MILSGAVHKFGDNVDTDVIIPARYLSQSDPAILAQYCMQDIDANFAKIVEKGDIIVAGKNFGCGSSREHAPIAIKASGISCVIAPSFARIFYRNAINIGLPILECDIAYVSIDRGNQISVDLQTGTITNHTKGETYSAEPFPEFIQNIIQKGGLIEYTSSQLTVTGVNDSDHTSSTAGTDTDSSSNSNPKSNLKSNSKSNKVHKIALAPGDGIGPEVIASAKRVLEAVSAKEGIEFQFEEIKIGGHAIDATGTSLPEASIKTAKACDAVLLGAVGGPKWDHVKGEHRPEAGLLKIRKSLGVYANLRPAILYESLKHSCPLNEEISRGGFDIMVVRELTGGIYFGEKGTSQDEGMEKAYDIEAYSRHEIERIAKVAFEMALGRSKKVISVDKANVLESSRLWRKVTEEVSRDYPEVTLEHMYVDNAAMQLIKNPKQFDVILTSNLFGDILSDEASMITGSIGIQPSASIGAGGFGLYEPIHGSAPDIAGKGIANSIATVLSASMLLRKSLGQASAADTIENAVKNVLAAGYRTKDLTSSDEWLSTSEMTDKIIEAIQAPAFYNPDGLHR